MPTEKTADPDPHSTYSTLREHIVEHIFVGDALRRLWCRKVHDVEVMRSEFDAFGYDLIMARGNIVRHIQLKTGLKTGKCGPTRIAVAEALAVKPGGCLLYIHIDKDLNLGPFFWFGGQPDQPLPPVGDFKRQRSKKTDEQSKALGRKGYRVIPPGEFTKLDSIDAVLEHIFGRLLP